MFTYFYLAGMFGLQKKSKKNRNSTIELNDIYKKMINASRVIELDQSSKKKIDQKLLKTLIWPHARNDSLIHDSYTCKNKSLRGVDVRPFPTRRLHGKYNFVGSNGGNITLSKDGPCPKQCRPIEHQDWVVC